MYRSIIGQLASLINKWAPCTLVKQSQVTHSWTKHAPRSIDGCSLG